MNVQPAHTKCVGGLEFCGQFVLEPCSIVRHLQLQQCFKYGRIVLASPSLKLLFMVVLLIIRATLSHHLSVVGAK